MGSMGSMAGPVARSTTRSTQPLGPLGAIIIFFLNLTDTQVSDWPVDTAAIAAGCECCPSNHTRTSLHMGKGGQYLPYLPYLPRGLLCVRALRCVALQ